MNIRDIIAAALEGEFFKVQEFGTGRGIITSERLAAKVIEAIGGDIADMDELRRVCDEWCREYVKARDALRRIAEMHIPLSLSPENRVFTMKQNYLECIKIAQETLALAQHEMLETAHKDNHGTD